MMNAVKKFIKSIYGGAMVSFGGIVYLSSDNKYIGALLFALGLFTICEFGFGLFTGRVGNLLFKKPAYIVELIVTLVGNLVGCLLIAKAAGYAKPKLVEVALVASQNKLSENLLQNFLLACMCGIMMFIAVETYKTKQSPAKYLGIFLAVPLFIVCGFEHSIANMFFFALADVNFLDFMSFTAVTVLGNAVGSIVFSLFKFLDKNDKKA